MLSRGALMAGKYAVRSNFESNAPTSAFFSINRVTLRWLAERPLSIHRQLNSVA